MNYIQCDLTKWPRCACTKNSTSKLLCEDNESINNFNMSVHRINLYVVCGVVAATTGALLTVGWPHIFHLYRLHMMVLTNSSMSFNIWKALPIPLYTEFYLYNITNVDDILAGKIVKIRVQQMGPYVFKETQKKVNVIWNANSTVSYQIQRVWHFQPDRSNGSLSDMVTNINPIVPGIAYFLRTENSLNKILANMITKIYFQNIFLSSNVSCWLFDGIGNNLLSIGSKIPNMPIFVPYDKIAWLYTRNGSADYEGWFVMNTGAEDFSQFGNVEVWRHSNQTVFPGSCGQVRGSTGELWAPKKGQTEISIFASDLHSTLTLAAREPVTILGVEGMMFVSNDSLFDNGQKYSSKACFCEQSPDDCMPSGVMNASLCAFGLPTFITLPHFRGVDSYYADKIDGMEPTEEHDFKMVIETVTGMPLMARAQIQTNILVRHSPFMTLNNQLPDPDVLVPMLWVRQPALVDDEYSSFAKQVLMFYYGMPYVFYALIAMGVMLLSAGLWIMRCPNVVKPSARNHTETHKFLTQSDSN